MGAALAGGALAAVGSIGGALLSQEDSPSPRNNPGIIFDPRSDPTFAALAIEQAINIGQFQPGFLDQFSPSQRLGNSTTASLGTVESAGQFQALLGELRNVVASVAANGGTRQQAISAANAHFHNSPLGLGRIQTLVTAGAAGFGGLDDFLGQEFDFEQRKPQLEAEAQRVSDAVRQGRNNARTTEAAILSDLFLPTEENLQRTVDERQAAERASIAAFINEQANVGGFNPAGALANEALNADARGQDTALNFILGLIGAQGGQLGNIRNTLTGQEAGSLAAAGLSTAGGLQANSLAAQQALGFANLRSQVDANNANRLNQGISSGANSLANAGFTAAILPDVLEALRKAGERGNEPNTQSSIGLNSGPALASLDNLLAIQRLGAAA